MFRDISYYKSDLDACMARVRAFFGCKTDAPGALIITFPSVLALHGPALSQYDFETDLCTYLDDYLKYQAQTASQLVFGLGAVTAGIRMAPELALVSGTVGHQVVVAAAAG